MVIRPSAEMIQAIGKYKNGNAQAFEVIYNISLPYVSKCILNVTNRTAPDASEDLMQDILQDTYMSVAEKMDTLQNEEAFFQWAGQIATNHALRTWSKSTRQKEQERSEDELLYEIPDERFIPEDILENKEKQRLIRQMIQELPTGQYLCLVEYFYNGLKETEIAEKLDMPLGTVKTNLFRAKKKMKQIVQTHEKKHGVKLYSMSWLLLLLFWDEIKDAFVGTGVVLAEATGTAAAAGAGTAVTGAGASAAGTGTAVTGLGVKIATGVIAAVVLMGSAVGINTWVKNEKEDNKVDSSATDVLNDQDTGEELGENDGETVTLETEPEAKPEKNTLVVDAYCRAIGLPDGKERCYHIPKINMDTCNEVNQVIYDTYCNMIEDQLNNNIRAYEELYYCHSIRYISNQMDDIVSVVVAGRWSDNSYRVYNVNTLDGSVWTSEQILQLYGFTQSEFEELVKNTFQNYLDELTSGPFTEEFLQYMKDATLSKENIAKAIPFIGPDGHLCFVGEELSQAGSGHRDVVYDIETGNPVSGFECEMDHSDSLQVFNKDMSQEEAYKIACEYWGVTPEDAVADSKFSIGCFGIQSHGKNNYYHFALRQSITEGSNSWVTTLDIVFIDTWTGQCKMNLDE